MPKAAAAPAIWRSADLEVSLLRDPSRPESVAGNLPLSGSEFSRSETAKVVGAFEL